MSNVQNNDNLISPGSSDVWVCGDVMISFSAMEVHRRG